MAEPGFNVNKDRFSRALKSYMASGKRDVREVLNRKAKDLIIKTAMRVPAANRSAIRNLNKKDWWPKYIAKVISRTGHTLTRSKSVKGAFGRKKKTSRTFTLKGGYTVNQARMVSRDIIGKRSRGVGFLRHALLESGRPFGVSRKSQDFKNARGRGQPATLLSLRAVLVQEYMSRRPGSSPRQAARIVRTAMGWALREIAVDMEKHVANKLRARGRAISGRR